MSSDRRKPICLWMTIYRYMFLFLLVQREKKSKFSKMNKKIVSKYLFYSFKCFKHPCTIFRVSLMICYKLCKDAWNTYRSKINNQQHLCAPIHYIHIYIYVGWLVGFYGISTFIVYLMQNPFLYTKSVLFQRIQFSMSTQFNCQKHFYFKRISLVKQF